MHEQGWPAKNANAVDYKCRELGREEWARNRLHLRELGRKEGETKGSENLGRVEAKDGHAIERLQAER